MARGRKVQSAEEREAKGNPGKRGSKASNGKATAPPLPHLRARADNGPTSARVLPMCFPAYGDGKAMPDRIALTH